MSRLWLMFSLPRFRDDPEKTRRAQLLHLVSLILFITIIFLLLTINWVLDRNYGSIFNFVLTGLAILQVITLLMIRRGQVQVAGFLLLTFSWMGITWLASVYDGVHSVILFAYFTITLGAGYVFGWRMVTLFTTWSILAVWVLAIYEAWGLSRPVLDDPISVAIILTALFIFSSIQIYFIISVLKRSLRESDQELRERLRIEQELRREQERLALAFDASKMGTWNWDIGTGAVSWSDKIEGLFGINQGEFDGKYDTYLSLIHPEDLPGLQQAIVMLLLKWITTMSLNIVWSGKMAKHAGWKDAVRSIGMQMGIRSVWRVQWWILQIGSMGKPNANG